MRRLPRFLLVLAAAAALAACSSTPPGDNDGGGGSGGSGGAGGSGGGGGAGGGSPDLTPPRVVSTTPADLATNVQANSPISIEFSKMMNTASVTVTFSPAVTVGAPTWSFGDTMVYLVPSAPLAYSTSYTINVTGQDTVGNALAFAGATFTTQAPPDTSAPYIVSTTPPNAATDVAVDGGTVISVAFSRAMDIGTVSVTGTPSYDLGVPGWSTDNKTVSFPAAPAPLAPSTGYSFAVAGKSTLGNTLDGGTTFAFTTAAPPDSTPPTVTGSAPTGTGVTTAANISLTFSEPMNKALVEAAFSTTPSTTGSFFWNSTDSQVNFIPAPALSFSTPYTVTLGVGAKDKAGNALAAPYTWSFTTAAAPDTTPPTIVSTSPAASANGASRGTNITVTFSEAVNKANAQAAFSIVSPGGFMGGVFSWDSTGTAMTYSIPSGSLFAYGAYVSFRVSTTVTDLAGNALATQLDRSFQVIRQGLTFLYPVSALDGFVKNDGTVNTTSTRYGMGDDALNLYYRSFMTFDLSGIPASATITSATLNVYQAFTNNAPYGAGALGDVLAQSVNYGASLTAASFDVPILQTWQRTCGPPYPCLPYLQLRDEVMTLSTDATYMWKQASATRKVADDWANKASRGSRSQYRLRFTNNVTANSIWNVTWFENTRAPTNRPYLAITYEYP